MGKWTAERRAASTGIGFVVLLLIGNFIAGSPPKVTASAAKDASWYMDKHTEIAIGGILLGIALVLFLWFLASFAGAVREAGQGRIATIMYGAGVVTVAMAAIGDATNLALSRLASFGDANTVQGLYVTGAYFYQHLTFGIFAFAAATALGAKRGGLFGDWYVWVTEAGCVVFLLGALSERSHGFFSPSGGMGFITFIVFAAWVLVSSVLLVQRTAAEPMPAAATASM